MQPRHLPLLLIALAAIATLTACSSNSSTVPVTVAFTSGFTPPASLGAGATAGIAATVTNDPDSEGVNWSVTCATPPCGSFNPATTASTVPTTYTATTTDTSVTITATSVYDTTQKVSATISITQGAPLTVTLTPPVRSSMNVNSTAQFAAVVANDPNDAGVNWSVTCTGIADCGSFNPAATPSSVSTTYTAPASVPTNGTVTITATSVTDTSSSASATVTITSAPAVLSDGNYVFHVTGTDNTAANGQSPYYIVGVLNIASGIITGGELDFDDENSSLFVVFNNDPGAFTITASPDGNLLITINTSYTTGIIGVNGVLTLDATLISPTHALITEFDTFATGTGSIDLQSATSLTTLQGYAFYSTGSDSSSLPLAFGGILNVDGPGGSISGNGSVLDINDENNVSPMTDQNLTQSYITQSDDLGRVTITIDPSNSQIPQITFIGYVVDPYTVRFLEPPDLYGGLTGGVALGQGTSTGNFSGASLAGLGYTMGLEGTDPNGLLQIAGTVGFDSQNNGVTGTVTFNDIASQFSGPISAGTYAVDATGRVTLDGLSAGSVIESGTLQLYLDGNGNALVVSMDLNDVTAGPAYQQTSAAAFSGNYATNADGLGTLNIALIPWSAVGSVVVDSSGNITGFTDSNYLGASTPTAPNVQLSGTATGSSQPLTGTLTGLGVTTAPDSYNYYVIDANRAWGIESDDLQLGLAYFEVLSN